MHLTGFAGSWVRSDPSFLHLLENTATNELLEVRGDGMYSGRIPDKKPQFHVSIERVLRQVRAPNQGDVVYDGCLCV